MNARSDDFEIENLRVTPQTGEVIGPAGREVLDPRVMDVLVFIAARQGQVVSRDDLMSGIWRSTVVTDDAVTRCFYELRRHLNRAGGDARLRNAIETLPKRGYRLNAAVRTPEPGAAAQRPGRPPMAWSALGVVIVLAAVAALPYFIRVADQPLVPSAGPPVHTVAVLPFLDLSAEGNQGYFADGMTEEILNRLAQSQHLRVTARTSAFALRDSTLDVPQIAARLGVSYVLEGSIRKSGERLRVTAQLIDASTNAHIWSRTFDRNVSDIFGVQDEIAAAVAAQLQAELTDAGSQAPGLDAYERFLQGQFFHNRRATGDIELAIRYYREAVALKPGYARAWASLSGAYSLQSDAGPGNPTYRDLQGEAARRAVEADPELAVAHARMSQYYLRTGRREDASKHWQRAVDLDPDDPLVLGFSSTRILFRGDLEGATEIWRKLVELDPLSPMNRHNYGVFLTMAGRLDAATVELRKATELSPGASWNRVSLARTLILDGKFEEAAATAEPLPAGLERDLLVALLYRSVTHREAADAALARVRVAPLDMRSRVRLAEAYVERGESGEAFRLLAEAREACERAWAENPTLVWYLREDLMLAPFLKPLHPDPRWAKLTAPRE